MTVAAEGAHAVDALAMLAEVGQHLALINVCEKREKEGYLQEWNLRMAAPSIPLLS